MRPATRTSLVEFRSILLPPIRIPVHALGALYRPQCSRPAPSCAPLQCLTQRRGMNLYKTARSKTLLGQHKSLTFSSYEIEPPSASSHRINLFETDKHHSKYTLIAKDVSLQEAYDNYVKPGHMIYCTKQLKKGMAKTFMTDAEKKHILDEYKNFSFVEARSHRIALNSPQKGRQLGGLKNIIFNESSPISHFRLSMDRAYQFVDSGSPVEVRIRLQGSVAKEQRLMPGNPAFWPWMHTHFPHLRPDFILKGMPEGTIFLINPVSDGRVCQWVMAKPTAVSTQDLNKRFVKVQKGVIRSIRQGQQEMLPQRMRLQLAESGNENYSPTTGMPKSKAKAKYGQGGSVTYGAEEKKHLAKDAETSRFLQPDEDKTQGAEDKGAVEEEEEEEDVDEDEDEFKPRYRPRHNDKSPPEPKHRWLGRGSRR
ncbi:hypothetical protein COCMIDRAFT_94845 [Bipolaris oryzae ATCC 44560]|uniref:Uncharacterized protein n=1 Tax=Bipolaris oryzae ATCC 44560 TaxID=930090 RepID=W6Z6Y0_COCMI|nr:uncharacterized protein COCMIDRAFT_94845 [Bipolaris oryzae ATCC 44560]EUC45725.1 hypothetical protein COCMIDRAFT_94845 [Bipolaris oryzae ATCC 44560]